MVRVFFEESEGKCEFLIHRDGEANLRAAASDYQEGKAEALAEGVPKPAIIQSD